MWCLFWYLGAFPFFSHEVVLPPTPSTTLMFKPKSKGFHYQLFHSSINVTHIAQLYTGNRATESLKKILAFDFKRTRMDAMAHEHPRLNFTSSVDSAEHCLRYIWSNNVKVQKGRCGGRSYGMGHTVSELMPRGCSNSCRQSDHPKTSKCGFHGESGQSEIGAKDMSLLGVSLGR